MLIYLITNTKNNKKYVGQTLCSIEKRWQEHIYNSRGSRKRERYPLYAAIRKYGSDSFIASVLDTAQSQDELNQKEIEYIKQFRTTEKDFGYNRHEGGNRPPQHTTASRLKAAQSNRGQKRSEECKKRMSDAQKGNKNFFGHRHSDETKRKMSTIHKERCRIHGGSRLGLKSSPEHIEKNRIAHIGKRQSSETKKKISISKTNPSAETRKNLRESHIGKSWSPARILAYIMKTVAWG